MKVLTISKITLKRQFSLFFSDGLILANIKKQPQNTVLNYDLPPEAKRMVIEKPYFWECKFLAYVIQNEMSKLKKHKWDYKYEIIDSTVISYSSQEFIQIIQDKFNEITMTIDNLGIVINTTIQDAIAAPGEPSDLELMMYTAKWLAEIYRKLLGWSLYFKTIRVDNVFDHLLELVYAFPQSALNSIDDFVNRLYTEITGIPNVADGIEKNISLKLSLDGSNSEEIQNEIKRLTNILT